MGPVLTVLQGEGGGSLEWDSGAKTHLLRDHRLGVLLRAAAAGAGRRLGAQPARPRLLLLLRRRHWRLQVRVLLLAGRLQLRRLRGRRRALLLGAL
jgi:hypothetical protein